MDILDVQNYNIKLGMDLNTEEIEKNMCIRTYTESDIPYELFFYEHMFKNIPCIIKSVTNQWHGLKWIVDNKPNFQYLIEIFGDASVPVANCGNKYYNSQKKEEQLLKEYLDYWQMYILKNYPNDIPCLYLKDWHFTRNFPEENIYRVPNVFASDWLNEYFSAREDIQDDYRFIYMGPKGSWTPFHVDVFTSFSWSVNLCGKKRWVLYPPGQEKHLVDNQGNLAYDIESSSLKNHRIFKNNDKLEISFEIIQNPGEAIFVPSGWHHQVWNLDDTISINHNWVNGCNIGKMWTSLQDNLVAVKSEIADCQEMEDWNEHCQVMLNATYGLDYKEFCRFLLFIVHIRLKHLREHTHLKVNGDWFIGPNHLKFDLTQTKIILTKLLSDENFRKLKYFSNAQCDIRTSLEQINRILGEQ